MATALPLLVPERAQLHPFVVHNQIFNDTNLLCFE